MPSLFTRLALLLERVFLHLTQPTRHPIALSTLTDLTRSKSELIAENALLRQQLIILQRQIKKPLWYTKTPYANNFTPVSPNNGMLNVRKHQSAQDWRVPLAIADYACEWIPGNLQKAINILYH